MKKISPLLSNALKTIILPVILIGIITIGTKGKFLSVRTITMLIRQAMFPTLIAWALSFNMVMGVFDFSPGSVVVLSGILGGNIAVMTNTGFVGMVIFTVLFGALLCMVNCIVFTKLRIPSIIVSLGMLMVYETLTMVLFDGKGVMIPVEWRKLYSVPYVYLIFIGLYALMFYINRYTKLAANVRALGYGTKVAMNIGVDLQTTRYKTFLLEGLFLGIAAVIDMSMTGGESAVQNMASGTTAFSAIMAVFVGMYLAKYCGLMMGAFIGAFSLKILAAGTIALGFSSQMQKVSNGIFLIVFVGLSQNISKLTEIRERKKEISKIQEMIKREESQEEAFHG